MEYWKCIKYGECRYSVSNMGRVKNNTTGKILKGRWSRKGYLFVSIYNGSRMSKKECRIHRLVSEAFIPNPENKPQVNHINSDKQDNRVENLEWCTALENIHHAMSQGVMFGVKSQITKDTVINIRNEYAKNKNQSHLARSFGIPRGTIRDIITRRTWKHI